ncbi:hypothetical protein A3Q56_00546, partial [Intoshia linei]
MTFKAYFIILLTTLLFNQCWCPGAETDIVNATTDTNTVTTDSSNPDNDAAGVSNIIEVPQETIDLSTLKCTKIGDFLIFCTDMNFSIKQNDE